MSKALHAIKLHTPEAVGFMFNLYHLLDVGGPAEKDLSDFGDRVVDTMTICPDYDFYVNGVKVEQFELTWKPANEKKQR